MHKNQSIFISLLPTAGMTMLMRSGSGRLQSPNYPSLYPHWANCIFSISLPVGNRINLNIKNINIQGCSGCICDSLNIYDGSYLNSTKLATICNAGDTRRSFNSLGNNLLVVFKSDGDATGPGFKAKYKAIQSGMKHSFLFMLQQRMV